MDLEDTLLAACLPIGMNVKEWQAHSLCSVQQVVIGPQTLLLKEP